MSLSAHSSLSLTLWSYLCENPMKAFKSVSITKALITWPLGIGTFFCLLKFLDRLGQAKQSVQLDLTSDKNQERG